MGAIPSTRRGRSSRDRIIDAACTLFFEQGVTATGLAEVIASSGTGKGQLYHYFSDKADLVGAVIDVQVERTILPQHELAPTTLDGLREWARIAVAQHADADQARCPLGSLVGELSGRDPEAMRMLQRGFDRWRALLAAWISTLQENGEVRADRSAASLAHALLAAYEGGLILAEAQNDLGPLRDALDIVIDGLAQQQPPPSG